MKNRKMLLPFLLSIGLVFSLILPASAAGASAAVPRPDDYSISHWVVDSSSAASTMALNTPQGNVTPMVAAGKLHTVGLKSDGTVVAVGDNDSGRRDVGGWTDIVQVAAGEYHTVGVKSDGTVVAVGFNGNGQCDVGNWTDIVQVAAGGGHTVGVKSDGTVVAVGRNDEGQCDIGSWTSIVQIAAGGSHTVGIKSDRTAVAVGDNEYKQCNVGGWTDIIQVATGEAHTVGLKSDGTVVAVGDNYYGGCNVGDWTGIVQVAAGSDHTVGLKADGTVVAVGAEGRLWPDYGECDVGGWTDIVQVAAGGYHTVGLKADGTVVAAGDYSSGQCDVGDWIDIAQVAAGYYHTVGAKTNGSVVAVGPNEYGQCDVGGWTNILLVAAGHLHTVGLKSDGTVVAVGRNSEGQCNVGGWTDITRVAAGGYHTVGLRSNGKVVAVGYNGNGRCDVGNWTDIVQVAGAGHAFGGFTVGIKSDGTVVSTGEEVAGRYNVTGWTGIVQVATGDSHTVGLKSDGTVVAVGYNSYGQCDVGDWTDITQVAAGEAHTVGLKSDGSVVAAGDNSSSQCDVGGWTDIIQVAAGYRHTVGLKSDGTAVAVGAGSEFIKWNLGATQYDLTISSAAGGSVITPGEGVFTSDAGKLVNLVAEPEEGYHFVRWTGDVMTIANANAAATNITMNDNYSITANFAIPPVQYNLTISSTAGGSVTTPGEGAFVYDEGTVVDLVAEPDAGYRFVNWTGDVGTIGSVTTASTNITMNGDYSITAKFVSVEADNVSIEAGDWIKIEYKITGWPAGQPYPEWLKLEFLSVEGTSATVNATMRMSDGTEQSDTVPVDLAAGGGEAFGLSGFVISANLTTGDSVYMSGFGDVSIEGETTRTYAGARRTVVYTSFSQSGVHLTYYWDKLTGVLVEAATTYGTMTGTAKATETNMWEATATRMPWWPWVIVAVAAVGLGIFFVRRKRATQTEEG